MREFWSLPCECLGHFVLRLRYSLIGPNCAASVFRTTADDTAFAVVRWVFFVLFLCATLFPLLLLEELRHNRIRSAVQRLGLLSVAVSAACTAIWLAIGPWGIPTGGWPSYGAFYMHYLLVAQTLAFG